MDFGLAKLKGSLKLTRTSTTIGTVAYMAPEQIQGADADTRSDIFSFGILLYEMLTGQLPFRGDHEAATVYSIVNEEPAPPRRLRPELPPALEAAVLKALRKDPQERYPRMRDMADDLRHPGEHALTVARTRPRRRRALLSALVAAALVAVGGLLYLTLPRGEAFSSVAVLPFANPGGDPEVTYLCDGLSESLISSLSRLPDLKVKSFSSVMRYRDVQVDPHAVGQELGVRAVVTGSAMLHGNQLAVTMELVDAADNSHLWGERWQSSLSDVLAFQKEIARAVPEGLRLRLSRDDEAQLAKGLSSSKEAYLEYLKGRYHWNRRTPDDIAKATELFAQALSIDPLYARAYAGLADCYNLLGSMQYAVLPPAEAMPRAAKAAGKALEIDERLAEAHVSLGHVRLFFDWNPRAAEIEFKRAIELNPDYPTAHQWYGDCLLLQNRWDEAIAEKQKALDLDPLSLIITMDMGTARYYMRDYDAAIEQCRKTLDMDPTFLMARVLLARAYVQKRMFTEAIAELRAVRSLAPAMTLPAALLGHALGVAGNKRQAEALLGELTEEAAHTYVPAHEFAAVNLGLGRKREALTWLRKAFQERSGLMIYLPFEPAVDPLRSDPAFAEVIRDVAKGAH
jgi:serine/threonine-protein kinase